MSENRPLHIETLDDLRNLKDDILTKLLTRLRNAVPVKQALKWLEDDHQITVDKRVNLQRFFKGAAKERWRRRYESAAVEADAILSFFPQAFEKNDEALIAALKQETFRLLVQEELEPARVKQFFELFLKEKTSALAQAKHEADRQEKLTVALDAFAEHLEDDAHAAARTHYAALRAAVLTDVAGPSWSCAGAGSSCHSPEPTPLQEAA